MSSFSRVFQMLSYIKLISLHEVNGVLAVLLHRAHPLCKAGHKGRLQMFTSVHLLIMFSMNRFKAWMSSFNLKEAGFLMCAVYVAVTTCFSSSVYFLLFYCEFLMNRITCRQKESPFSLSLLQQHLWDTLNIWFGQGLLLDCCWAELQWVFRWPEWSGICCLILSQSHNRHKKKANPALKLYSSWLFVLRHDWMDQDSPSHGLTLI